MSSLLSAELSATCNALGTFNKKTGKYMIDDFTLNTVKDLIRYMRRDGEDHEIRRHLGQTKVLQSDLLPMLVDHWENNELFDVTLRLVVNLTNPALLLFREEVPVERTARHNYLQILSHLQSYKEEAFSKVENWQVFAKKLTKILEIDWSERDEDTGLVIERILILIRNVLHVPADLDKERRPDNDASIHDQVLWALNQSGILDIILYMSSENEKQYFMHILEIITHLLREQNPTSLADAALQRSVDEKLRDEQELLTIRMSETKERVNKVRQYSSTRHSRFGGTYVIQNMKSISENELICLKPLNKISNLDFNGSKKSKLVKPKNRRPEESGAMERRSPFAVRLFLKEFCIEFLNSAYNPLMHYVKDVLVRAKAQQNDESYFLWAMRFFMEFNRGHKFDVALVGETMSVPMFHYVQQQMEKYYDMIRVEKKKYHAWVRRLHLALKCYKELLNTLLVMDKSESVNVKESAKVIKSNVFYVLEYREFVLATILNYDDNKMPRSYLLDLVETVHLFLKMLEHYCKKTGLVVQKKIRRKAKSKKPKPRPKPQAPKPDIPQWEAVREQMAVVLTSRIDNYPPPFDAASDTPIDQQKEDCMKKIQKLMREQKYEDAVGTFRAAREVWPEEGIFGVEGIQEHEELDMLETIYSTDLGVEIIDNVEDDNQEDNSEYDEEDEEEEDRTTAVVETEFDFQDFVQRFCHPRVVSACASLLERYEKNAPHTNHCIVKMLHRIAWDCKRPAMMFQASMFLTFQKILGNRVAHFKELEKFAIYVLRKFSEVAGKSPKAFIELLFWTSSKDAIDVECGYDLYNDPRDKPGKNTWSEEQEEELRKLYMENQSNPQTDQDVIDWILDNLIDQTRTRRSVISKLKELGLIFKAPTKKSNKERRVQKEFSEEEDTLLEELWTQFKETDDPMPLIMARMPRKRQKRSFIDRLLELGLIQDKKQCRKKRQRKEKSGPRDDTEDESKESNSESDTSRSPSPVKIKPKKKVREEKKRNRKRVDMSAKEIAILMVKAVDNGQTGALTWLAENLEEVALDQEAEGYDPSSEGIPLVPISRDAVEAMDDNSFQKVLRAVGVMPPSDEQESYWRIPADLHHETIRKRREIILKAINKELIVDPNISDNETDKNKDGENIDMANDSDSNDSRQEAINDDNDMIMNTANDDSDSNDIRQDSVINDDARRVSQKSSASHITINNDASDDSDDETNKIDNDDKFKTNTPRYSRKRVRSVDIEEQVSKLAKIDEDDEDILSFAKKTLNQEHLPDTEDILSALPQRDNDSSDEDAPINISKRKKRLVVSDDSE
ncbi:protein timeless homolog [Zerene cesonia]|uniref:protein timeless homolog n=1 Tax=Zerene cesonia TaxID=33412 RepID=UPI0018E4E437|nr:protein timeless homolog [Zerene cesonia]